MKKRKARILEEVVRGTWASLESHLPYCYTKSKEGKRFNRKCVKEYAEMIHKLAKVMQ